MIKTLITTGLALAAVAFAAWKLFLFEQWVEDVEYEANVDANAALEDLDEAQEKRKAKKEGKKKAKNDADEILAGEGKK